jgi:hypothetical protein
MLQDRSFFQQGVNEYVPAMGYACAPIHAAPTRFNLGTPAAAVATAVGTLISAQGTVGPITYFTTPIILDARYGRTITYTPSGVPGNANAMDIVGYDYLMQPMVERITGSAAASALIAGLKAFKIVIGTRVNVAATNVITFSIGTGLSLGLPYKGRITNAKEDTTELTYAQINTATVAAVLTDPQTAVTGDPRGLYTPLTAPNGTLRELGIYGDAAVNTAGNGGLVGIRHFSF